MSPGITHIALLFRLLRWRLVLLISIGLFAVVFEAVGVAAFLPLVEGEEQSSRIGTAIRSTLGLAGIRTGLGTILIFVGFVFVVRSILLGIGVAYIGRLRGDLLVRLRQRIFLQIFGADYAYYARREVGWVSNVVTTEYDQLTMSIQIFNMLAMALFFAVFYVILPLVLSPWVSLAALVAGVPLLIVVKWANSATTRYSIEITENTGVFQQGVIQVLSNYRYLKATAAHNVVLRNLDSVSSRLSTAIGKQSVVHGLGTHGFTPVTAIIVFGLLYIQVEALNTPLLESLFILFLLRRSMDQFVNAQTAYRLFLSFQGSIQAYSDLDRDLEANVEPGQSSSPVPADFDQDMRITNVSYSYPGRTFELKNINFTIPAKSTVALVGASGSGKSTMGLLLAGVLRPEFGSVQLADQNIQDLSPGDYRRNIGFVTQESVIFNDTIENNISLWASDTNPSDVISAARLARVDEFVRDMPDGYRTILGDYGALVSGGQRQRIALARELYKEIRFLILDEATSALDSESESAIQQNIDDLKGKQTIVIITHRLSTIRNSDLVCFFEDGKLLNKGTYEELYRSEAKFRNMVDLQNAGIEKP
jgi:subfamily B ATP-binding cassette protein MsbA